MACALVLLPHMSLVAMAHTPRFGLYRDLGAAVGITASSREYKGHRCKRVRLRLMAICDFHVCAHAHINQCMITLRNISAKTSFL